MRVSPGDVVEYLDLPGIAMTVNDIVNGRATCMWFVGCDLRMHAFSVRKLRPRPMPLWRVTPPIGQA